MSIDKQDISLRLLCCAACIAASLSGVIVSAADEKPQTSTKLIVDFGPESTPWRNIDDVVMGGVSSSRMRIDGDVAVFEGNLSLENNGGFASVRSEVLEQDLTRYEGCRLRVKGDGKKYQFRIRTNSAFDGPSYQMTFETKKDVWMEVDLPFSEFVAAFRGRRIPNHPPIDAAKISTMGLLIADKQQGDFRLVIDWVQAYRVGGETGLKE